MEKNVAGKWIVFAYGLPNHASPGVAIAGDAANITANIRIDGGAANAVDDVNPTELEDGYYIFDITAVESNGENLLLTPQSATANVQVIAVPGAVWTRPANFSTLGIEADGDITQVVLTDTTTTNTDMVAEAPTVVAVADQVWDEALSGHNTGGTTGKALKQIVESNVSVESTVNDGAATTLSFITALTEATDNHYIDVSLVFIDGALAGQSRPVLSYNGTTKTITFEEALTEAPTNGDGFIIKTDHVHPVSQLADGILDEALSGHTTAGTLGKAISDIETDATDILIDTNELQVDSAAGNLGVDVDKINGVTITGDGNTTPFDVV